MPPPQVNPQAMLKSYEEMYNGLLSLGVSDPTPYNTLWAAVSAYGKQLRRDMAENPRNYNRDTMIQTEVWIAQTEELSGRMKQAAANAGLVQYSRARDSAISPDATTEDMISELEDLMNNRGLSLTDAVKVVINTGRFDAADVQKAAYLVGNPQYDPAAAVAATGTGDTAMGAPGLGGGSKPFEPITQDITNPQEAFQLGFAQFTRGLSVGKDGQAPNIAVLSARYQDLYNTWLGAVESGKAAGTEPANVFKEAFVNIGKSTDPQFDQTNDRFQLKTVLPNQSVVDWLTKNVDPEDVYTSTAFADRPGRATGGFRGYVRRSNV